MTNLNKNNETMDLEEPKTQLDKNQSLIPFEISNLKSDMDISSVMKIEKEL